MQLIGHDCEVFLLDEAGKFISAINRVGGDKSNPLPTKHGFVQEDNVLAELNINPVELKRGNANSWVKSCNDIMGDLTTIIAPQGLRVKIIPSAYFDEDQLDHPLAMRAGCDPDYCIYSKQKNPRPKLHRTQLRTAAGHLHFSFDDDPTLAIKSLDMHLGLPSLFLDLSGTTRRELYGKAGAFRDKPYGFEYRTLSNFWLSNDKLMTWVYDNSLLALERVNDIDFDLLNIEGIINNNLLKEAENIINVFNIPV